MKKLTITVGIPAYNEESTLPFLLDSLLKQKGDKFKVNEIVVIDDNSTDNSKHLLKKYKKMGINVFTNVERIGQAETQNLLLNIAKQKSDALLLLEADTQIDSTNYINLLAAKYLEGYDIVYGTAIPLTSENFFENTMNVGYYFRQALYRNESDLNVYMCFGQNGRLINLRSVKKFNWNSRFHEDSFLFREAKKLRLKLARVDEARIIFKSVENFSDYLRQSIKFQKAAVIEMENSNIYKVKFQLLDTMLIALKYLTQAPLNFVFYILLVVISRVISPTFESYNSNWKIYESSKNMKKSNIKNRFNNASNYNQDLWGSKGLEYLSNIETSFIIEKTRNAKLSLDLGIGIGRNARILLDHGSIVWGLDFSEKMLMQVKSSFDKELSQEKLIIKQHNLNDKLPFADNEFDTAICIRVIKYVSKWKNLLKEMNRVIKKDGKLIIEIPNKWSVQTLSAIFNDYFTFDLKEFERELEASNFKIIEKKYGSKLPFHVYNRINNKHLLKKIIIIENLLNKIFKNKLSRNVVYHCISIK